MAPSRRYFGPQGSTAEQPFSALEFSGVSMRIFLLRANMTQLERFCDAYLNIAPAEMARFRPAAPFVMLQVLNYGRMSPVASNLGWVAQHEILFGIPLIGHWHENGRRVEGGASVSPFIFVDNDWSVLTGREIYGWPKYPAQLVPEVNPWMSDPRKPRRLLNLQTQMFPRLYSGESLQQLVLLELLQETSQVSQLPTNIEYLLNPLGRLPKAMVDLATLGPDLYRCLAQGWPSASGAMGDALEQLTAGLATGLPQTFFNTVNLKQFRSSEPNTAAYQSLVNGRMEVRRVNACGLLGSPEQLRGDPTGGFTILLHRYPDFPIVESLGLMVESRMAGRDVPVDILKPLMPFWVSLDLRYERGRRLCWRTSRRNWALGSESTAATAQDATAETTESGTPPHRLIPSAAFNTALGPVLEAVDGPFDFFDTAARVLPLVARWDASETLKSFLQTRLGGPMKQAFQQLIGTLMDSPETDKLKDRVPAGVDLDRGLDPRQLIASAELDFKLLPLIFVVVKRLGRTSAHVNNLGWWGGRSVELVAVLEMVLRIGNEPPYPRTHFLVTPYSFADTPMAVNAGREVLGLPTAFAAIRPGRDPWIESGSAETTRNLLNLTVRDYPALGVGQGAELRRLLEIERMGDAHARGTGVESADPADNPVSQLAEQWHDSAVRIPNLSLKQFRDEENPVDVCYRALVAQEQILGRWADIAGKDQFEIHPMRGRYNVRFHDLPSWPLVDNLGLEVDHWEVGARGAPIAVCDVHYPFFVRADLRWNLPVVVTEQAVDGVWEDSQRGIGYLGGRLSAWLVNSLLDLLARHLEKPGGLLHEAARAGKKSAAEARREFKKVVHHLLRSTGIAKELKLPVPEGSRDPARKDTMMIDLDRLVEDVEEHLERLRPGENEPAPKPYEPEEPPPPPVGETATATASVLPAPHASGGVDIRERPAADATVIGRLQAGESLPLLGTEGAWRKVRMPDGRTGWVASSRTRPQIG